MEPFTTVFLLWLVITGSIAIKYNIFDTNDPLEDEPTIQNSPIPPKYEIIDPCSVSPTPTIDVNSLD